MQRSCLVRLLERKLRCLDCSQGKTGHVRDARQGQRLKYKPLSSKIGLTVTQHSIAAVIEAAIDVQG